MADLRECDVRKELRRRKSGVGQPVLLDSLAVGLEHDVHSAQLADLLLGPLDHAVTFARVGGQHLAGAGHLEALFRARFGLQFGHLALLYGPETRAKGPVHRHMLETSLCMRRTFRRHGSPLAGRRKAGFMTDKIAENNRSDGQFEPFWPQSGALP